MTQTSTTPAAIGTARDLGSMPFESSFVDALPADPLETNVPRQVQHASYTRVRPSPVVAPKLLGWSAPLAAELGLERPSANGAALQTLAGNRLLPGMQPYAARYGGHQFGHWAGQLGDGRAITLGELRDAHGMRRELQLKGAGVTPYSRTADGRAVLRSSLREFLCSEAMHFLGVPTTRALSLVATGESVVRDMFYDGHPQPEPGAVVARVAPSFVRFGNFEILAANGEIELLRRLADHVIAEHYPEFATADDRGTAAGYVRWFAEVGRRTAVLIAHWMRVGFVHGVLNTDNMSILGLTIDYGPYGWLEGYDPAWTPNTTDAEGRRYCFGNQPQIGSWNLSRLAGALHPLVGDVAPLQQALELYGDTLSRGYNQALADKLGLQAIDGHADEQLVADLFTLLQRAETDYVVFFRRLAEVPVPFADAQTCLMPLADAYYDAAQYSRVQTDLLGWLQRYGARVASDPLAGVESTHAARQQRMHAANPKYVFRNYLAQQAIDAATEGDLRPLERLLTVLQCPYDEQPEHDDLAAKRPEWARHKAGCSALSCSS